MTPQGGVTRDQGVHSCGDAHCDDMDRYRRVGKHLHQPGDVMLRGTVGDAVEFVQDQHEATTRARRDLFDHVPRIDRTIRGPFYPRPCHSIDIGLDERAEILIGLAG